MGLPTDQSDGANLLIGVPFTQVTVRLCKIDKNEPAQESQTTIQRWQDGVGQYVVGVAYGKDYSHGSGVRSREERERERRESSLAVDQVLKAWANEGHLRFKAQYILST